MAEIRDFLWCRHCDNGFHYRFDEEETGYAHVKCPWCAAIHHRQFYDGIATGDIPLNQDEPDFNLTGRRAPAP